MHLVSVFQHSIYLELAIIDLEQMGIAKENILALPLDKNGPNPPSFQAAHEDAVSYVDLAFILAMVFMLLGGIYGFILAWGPIIWALIGMVVGALLGLFIDVFILKKRKPKNIPADVVMMVNCLDNQAEVVEKILWSHQALGVAKQPDL
ncbi:hypothetical protein [Alicyclobacillus ferrooxydans]|uniref:Uncharacterized protein n=1 Tax=Alicyclobacillus ferrooxydans TaxID=471514 RepID=A0A0P9CY36_9BACL|nr:hypothetical protein [Alicyclobacillus ferrooxydans]KPV41794.1 hypothetical protein AN477_20375 [Alicyclobacillus ferrooxydans]